MISRACYCTREDVLNVLQVSQSPRAYPRIDRAIETATRNIDKRCHRTFHPYQDTKYVLWPEPNSNARSWRLWLDENELVSLTTLVSGNTVIPPSGYFLEPQQYGPPYTRIETNQASTSAFSSGPQTEQRAVQISGLFGYDDVTVPATTLAAAVAGTSTTSITVADGSQVGVGDLLSIGTERMTVTGRSLITSGQTLQTPITASSSSVALTVTTGSAFTIGETITLDVEQMAITSIAGNTLAVERAVNGTVLAVHTGSTIYVPRVLTVSRGSNGSTAATHSSSDVVSRQVVPAPVQSLTLAETIVELQQGSSGYARTAGSADNERPIGAGDGLNDLRDQVERGYRRKARTRVV